MNKFDTLAGMLLNITQTTGILPIKRYGESMIQMLAGESVKIDAGTFQNDITSIQKKEDALTLLVHLGYLAYNSNTETACIPNEEVKRNLFVL